MTCFIFQRVTNSSPLPSDVSVPLKEIYIPDEGCLMQVTSATSTIDLWVCSPSELHERLYNEMQKFYNDRCDVASNINKGGFYAAYVDDGWYRVRVISIADASVKCFFIDYGDTYVVSKKNIRLLEREFAKLPVQAIACYLGGLQELVNESTGSPHLEKLIGKIFIAKKLDITDEGIESLIRLRLVFSLTVFDFVCSARSAQHNTDRVVRYANRREHQPDPHQANHAGFGRSHHRFRKEFLETC